MRTFKNCTEAVNEIERDLHEMGVKVHPETMQNKKVADDKDFLSHYTWPEDPKTGDRLNWLTIPVADRHWTAGHANKGGFIQEATGWKPSILQPSLYLPGLLKAAGF